MFAVISYASLQTKETYLHILNQLDNRWLHCTYHLDVANGGNAAHKQVYSNNGWPI